MRRITRAFQRDDGSGDVAAGQQRAHGVGEKGGDLFFVSGLHEVKSVRVRILTQETAIITGGRFR